MMAPPISEQLRRRMLVWHHEDQRTAAEIAHLAGCSV
jgi:hypothetical protein